MNFYVSSEKQMIIRKATSADAQDIHDLHTRSVRGLCAADYEPHVIEGWLEGRSPEGYEGIAKGEMYVAMECGVIIGWSHVRPNCLVGLFVDPEHVRKGVGRALFEDARELMRSFGHELSSVGATLTAIPFYEQFGFEVSEHKTISKGSVEVPMVQMKMKAANQSLQGTP